jgi:hypothetical protein
MVVLAVALSACTPNWGYKYSPNMTEPAVVEDTFFSPRLHGSGLGVGITTGGSMALVPSSTTIQEKYAVVFSCQHGKFVVEGSDTKHRDLWAKLKRGQAVDIVYREMYRVDYGDRGEVVNTTLKAYDFIDAKVVN